MHHSQAILSASLSFIVGWGDDVAEYVTELEGLIECCLISNLLRDLLWDRWNFIITSAINHHWLLVEENFTWPRTALSAAAKEETVKGWKDGYLKIPETTELTNHKMENLDEIFFNCERTACFVAKYTYEVAQGHICLRMGCADRKSHGSSQKQPLKSTISSRGKGRLQGAFDFDEAEDASNICFLKGNDRLYGINIELNCLPASTEAHTTPINEYISWRAKEDWIHCWVPHWYVDLLWRTPSGDSLLVCFSKTQMQR